uniref:Ribosome-binding factor A n=1 Tax=Haemonchus placei TaxID=6290 RepID=A0A158QN14_HAEPC
LVKKCFRLDTCVLPRQSWRFDLAMKKNFQRTIGKRYGYDMGLEDRILLSSLGRRERRLDQKKMAQLSAILEAQISDAASANPEVSVTVNSSFTEVKVWWLCDDKIEECLERQRHSLRKAVADSIGVNCPTLQFLPDRSKLMEQEMDRLFQMADYGMDYRAVSHTGRVLGGAGEPKRRWFIWRRKKK